MSSRLATELVASRLQRMRGHRLVVVGDLFLDEYLIGRPERLSREGPVPVLAFQRRTSQPGGAANPARNIAALGSTVTALGVVGEDPAGAELCRGLADAGIDTAHVVVDPDRPTTIKTRVMAEGLSVAQPVARIDRQDRRAVSGQVEQELLWALERAAVGASAILVSHYRSGVVTPTVCDAARAIARRQGLILAVDAQGDVDWFLGFDLVRVGRADAQTALRRTLAVEAEFESAARELRSRLGARAVVIGRGRAGMSLADEQGYAVIPPANPSEVFDVAGAGDTVVAVMTLCLASGGSVREAASLATFAAGWVVRRLGAAAPTAEELLAEIQRAVDQPAAPT